MKKWLGFFGALLFSGVAIAQTTIVVGVATDSDSTLWANGTVSVQFVPNSSQSNLNVYRINGAPLSSAVTMQGPISLGSGGSFSVTVYDNTQVTPSGSQWQFTICPQATSKCGSVTTPVSGSGQSITTLIDAVIPAPRFPAVIGNYGYADVEAILQLVPGNIYYNVTNSCYRGYNGSIWSCITGQIFPIPVPIIQGGTGTTTAAGALANLGGAPLTGTGTSGTWPISITGNAATATNVAYSGLTGTVPTWNQSTTGNAATASIATNIAGGTGYEILVQTGANTTGFVTGGTGLLYQSSAGNMPIITSSPYVTANPNPYDASSQAANDLYVQNAVNLTMATSPFTITGGTISFNSLGSGSTLNYSVTSGAITTINSWMATGANYLVGDVITPQAGNYDAMIRVTAVNGSNQPTAGTILYGGTGYSAGTAVAGTAANTIEFTFLLSGTLTSNATLIMAHGTYLTQSNQWIFANNTTGAYIVTVCVGGATDACAAGGRTVVVPQGTNNSASELLQTDGELNVDQAIGYLPGYAPLSGATFTGAVSAPSLTDSGLTSGNCVQASTGGLLVTTMSACGSSAATTLATTTQSGNTSYYPIFVPANSSSNQAVSVGPMTYNPSTGNLTATSVNSLPLNYFTSNGGISIGSSALTSGATGINDVAVGVLALNALTSGANNVAVGDGALQYIISQGFNTAIGNFAGGGTGDSGMSASTFLGYETYPDFASDTNETVIGATAIGHGSNTVTLGNTSITDTYLAGIVHGTSFTGNAATFTGPVTFSGGGLAHAIIFPDPNAGAVYTASQVLGTFFSPMAGTVPAGGAGTYNGVAATSYCNLSTAATASTTFTFAAGGTSFGTVAFAASGTTGTFTISSANSVSSGDKITLTAPATADTTAAGLNCSLVFAY